MEVPLSASEVVRWKLQPLEAMEPTVGRYVAISPFDAERDAADFVRQLCGPGDGGLWTYIPVGPFASAEEAAGFFALARESLGWLPYVLRRPADGTLLGTASHMRVRPEAGSAEVGCVIFSPLMQRTAAATEAMYLLALHVLGTAGYRRYEWKCDDENQASKRAAARLGFVFEGVFRQDMIVRGRNRNTAWFSMLDKEWPIHQRAFESWLAPENQGDGGTQKQSLATLRRA